MNIIELAEIYAKEFITDTRNNGEEYIKIKDKPENKLIRTLVQDCHDGWLPDDWIYKTVYQCLIEISECNDEEELEEVDLNVFDSTGDLFEWGKKFHYYCEEYQKEFGNIEKTTVIDLLMKGIWYHRYQILNQVKAYLYELLEETNSELHEEE